MHSVDVAILGGGLAGNLLARQLRRELPQLSVAVFERDVERSYKVGESSVEIAAHYWVRRLGLATYLHSEHLPKNGLRFFFDDEKKSLPLEKMSELGVNGLPPYLSFQLDRARLEADLMRMNQELGADVRIGAKVSDLKLGQDGARHTFTVEDDESRTDFSARWVIDATGRESMVARQLDLRVPEKSHRIASSWGRFEGVEDMDDRPQAPAWRGRVNDTCRMLSTNHFNYPGYWIWFIPLREGLMSVGVVQESRLWRTERHKEAGLMAFLNEHEAVRSLLPRAKAIDVMAFTQLAYRTKKFFSADRWALIGDAAAFTDPFYSPGSDFIGTECDFVTNLIRREIAGEALEEPVRLFDEYMQYRFDTTLAVYDQLYPTFGSYELFRAKAYFDTGTYYNLLFDAFHKDEHLDFKHLRQTLRRRQGAMEMMTSVAKSFGTAATEMQKRGTYYRKNADHYEVDGREAFGAIAKVGHPRTRREIGQRTTVVLERAEELLRLALDDDWGPVERLVKQGDAFATELMADRA
jgi:flavin-dependent dehydrogenase